MNKYLYTLGLAGVALFSACSNSDDLSIVESPAIDEAKESALIYEAGQNSEVPITLGVNQSRGYTRKPIEGESNNPTYVSFDTEPGKYLGVFCLATGYQSSYASNPPIANNWTDDDDTGLIVRMKNVPATTNDEDGEVAFLNHGRSSGQHYFYPMGDWMKYNFYTYYPWQNEDDDSRTLVFYDDQVVEKYYTIDGSQDIIWGKADQVNKASVAADPYCAKYFRLAAAGGGDISGCYPKFEFQHKLVQFRFFVRAANPTASAKNIRVRAMNIKNAINQLALIVADKSSTNNKNGKLYWFGNSIKKERMPIRKNDSNVNRFDQNGDDALDYPLTITDAAIDVSTAEPVGYVMLAPPTVPCFNERDSEHPTTNDTVYELVVKVRYNDGGTVNDDITFQLVPPSGGFQEGKIYNIIININV